MNRNYTLDITRTLAIALMVIFHFIYDLKFFSYVDWDIPDGDGWRHFRYLIISLFFICLGMSMTFAHEKTYRWYKFIVRVGQISAAALVISLATYFAIPQNWIFFGVLHFLAFSSLVAIGFIRKPVLSLVIGITFIVVGFLEVVPSRWPFYLMFNDLPSYTNDFVAIVPWLGVVFIGISLAHTQYLRSDPLRFIVNNLKTKNEKNSTHWVVKCLLWPGQHSLSIYILHQPILMGLLFLVE